MAEANHQAFGNNYRAPATRHKPRVCRSTLISSSNRTRCSGLRPLNHRRDYALCFPVSETRSCSKSTPVTRLPW